LAKKSFLRSVLTCLGKSDPYIVVSCNEQEHKTAVKKRYACPSFPFSIFFAFSHFRANAHSTLSPEWQESFTFDLSQKHVDRDSVKVWFLLFDHDVLSKDDPLGEVVFDFKLSDKIDKKHYNVQHGTGNIVLSLNAAI
jgi:Ca2+-dependent lipid-binding protein